MVGPPFFFVFSHSQSPLYSEPPGFHTRFFLPASLVGIHCRNCFGPIIFLSGMPRPSSFRFLVIWYPYFGWIFCRDLWCSFLRFYVFYGPVDVTCPILRLFSFPRNIFLEAETVWFSACVATSFFETRPLLSSGADRFPRFPNPPLNGYTSPPPVF